MALCPIVKILHTSKVPPFKLATSLPPRSPQPITKNFDNKVVTMPSQTQSQSVSPEGFRYRSSPSTSLVNFPDSSNFPSSNWCTVVSRGTSNLPPSGWVAPPFLSHHQPAQYP